MSVDNPFEPPAAAANRSLPEHVAEQGPWRSPDGRRVFARSGRIWPRRCVKCDTTAVVAEPLSLRLRWAPAWVFLLIPLGLLMYVIARMMTRQEGRVRVFLCARHHRDRLVVKFGTPLALVALSVAGLGLSAVTDLQSFLVLPLGGVLAMFFVPVDAVWPRAIQGRTLELRGCCASFRRSLPAWDASSDDFDDLLPDE